MSKATEIVNNARAVGKSATASIVAGLVIFIPFSEWLITVAPDQYDAKIRAVSAGAATALVAVRTAYAWFDKGNLSFGRVETPPVETVDVSSAEAIESYLSELEGLEVVEGLLPDEHTTADEVETQPEPKGI